MHRFRVTRSRFAGLAVLALSSLLPIVAWAVCTCGFGDGRFTLVSINVNGNMNDWAPVHADLDNNVCDGPANALTDRDAPVQSNGRDLTHFAFTWDSNSIYLFTERAGSVSNTQTFVYYADTDNDRFMETGEPVIGVTWRGSNRRVNVYLFTYVAQAPGGDPMVDGNGFADGYTLPGSFANVPSTGNPTRSGVWGSSSGLQMEFAVAWSELGLAPGSPFTFHVSSSNASLGSSGFAAQIDDNLSGCGGGLGSTAQTAVTFVPDLSLTGIIGQTIVGAHTLVNEGNVTDTFDLAATISGDYSPSVNYYDDTDGSGTLTGSDALLTDTDGDGLPDTGPVAPGATISVLIAYDIPTSVTDGESAIVVSTASSNLQPLANDSVTDTISAIAGPELVLTKRVATVSDPVNLTVNPKPIPGSVVEYSITIANEGLGTVDADTIFIVDPIPGDACMIVDDIDGSGSGPVLFEDGSPSSDLSYSFISLGSPADDVAFSNDGGLTYNYAPTPDASGCDASVTHLDINPTGQFAGESGSGSPSVTFRFRARVN